MHIERHDQVALLRFGNPDDRSRWSHSAETDYFDTLASLEADPTVRVIVLTGASADFCAGPELDSLTAHAVRDPRGDDFTRTIAKPIIAAIDGGCHGIGLSLALMCDLRVASGTTRMSAGFASVGLVAEHGVPWLLQRVCGHGVAADLLFTDRRIDGAEARRLGIVQYLAEEGTALDEAMALAAKMAGRLSPLSLGVIKHQLNNECVGDLHETVERGEQLVQRVSARGDFDEAIAALRERRAPALAPLDVAVLREVLG